MHAILTAIAEADLSIEVKRQLLKVLGIIDQEQLSEVWKNSGLEPLEMLQDVIIVSENREANRR